MNLNGCGRKRSWPSITSWHSPGGFEEIHEYSLLGQPISGPSFEGEISRSRSRSVNLSTGTCIDIIYGRKLKSTKVKSIDGHLHYIP